MKTVFLAMPGNEDMASRLAARMAVPLNATLGELAVRRFPDGESYLRLLSHVEGTRVALVCTLDRPDDKLASLLFAASLLREQGAAEVGLVAPYLAYMRQDARFNPGEGITAHYFAQLLSARFDWLVTADPHLHRIASLDQVYDCATATVQAAPAIAQWIAANVENPLLIGPDAESEQWVSEVARLANAPCQVLQKVRHGDRDVEVSVPDSAALLARTPILVDDIASTGRTLIETIGHLHRLGARPPVCAVVHAIFAEGAHEAVLQAGAAQVVSCDTVPHASNRIALDGRIADGILSVCGKSANQE